MCAVDGGDGGAVSVAKPKAQLSVTLGPVGGRGVARLAVVGVRLQRTRLMRRR